MGAEKVDKRRNIRRDGNDSQEQRKERSDKTHDSRQPVKEIKNGCEIAEALRDGEAAHRERIRLKENLHVANRPPDSLFHGAFERFRHESYCQHLVEIT